MNNDGKTVLRGTARVQRASGVKRIAMERRRQIVDEGFTSEHDRVHDSGQLKAAALTMLLDESTLIPSEAVEDDWMVGLRQKHIGSSIPARIDRLVIAGALCAAEVDRLNAELDEEETT